MGSVANSSIKGKLVIMSEGCSSVPSLLLFLIVLPSFCMMVSLPIGIWNAAVFIICHCWPGLNDLYCGSMPDAQLISTINSCIASQEINVIQ